MSSIRKGLGSKGLGIEALINNKMNDLQTATAKDTIAELDINKIEPNREQPRKNFQEDALLELAQSMKQFGVIQPIIVRKKNDYYELIAGERRWRAAKIAGLKSLPAIIKEYDTGEAFEIALIENLQRKDLNPIEEALSYKRLIEEFALSQDEIGERVGKSRSTITNILRLLNLDERVQNFVIENKISNGHAKVLLAAEDKERQFELAEQVIEEGLSVRATEILLKQDEQDGKSKRKTEKKENTVFQTVEYQTIENQLKNIFGTKVKLQTGKNKGKIEIEYYSDEDLERLLGLIKKVEG